MYSTVVIAVAGVLLLLGTILPGVRLWWPQHRDPVSRSDLGVALMTGALIAFAVLGVQLLIQIRSQRDANAREDQADRAALLLQLGRSSNLSDLDLQGQDLSTAYLKQKDLSGANLSRSSMSRASLQGTKLVGATLSGVSLDKAQLQRADLRYAALDGASLVEANLSGANLDAATLTPGVDLTRADLSNASARADLRLAVLVGANLEGAQLDRANLQGANFTGADLQFADLRGADLRGANLLKAEDLDLARDLSRATYDRDTQWPATFYWPPDAIRPIRPRCSKARCELQDSPSELNALPQGLIGMREKLERAVNDADCLPGWLVEDQPGRIEAHAPRGGATFSILTENLPGTSPRAWAAASQLDSPKSVPSVTADGSARRVYAVRAEDLESSQPFKAVHVWFFRGPAEGFHAWAEAPPGTFSLFERDFIKLFAALGIEGDLFPWLRGGEYTCRP
jgi:uncharacterized protein YjbI with pentapeptide repeats